jgi:hypothetical protein
MGHPHQRLAAQLQFLFGQYLGTLNCRPGFGDGNKQLNYVVRQFVLWVKHISIISAGQ